MKAERRHELKGNDLAAMLESARDFLDRNGRQLGIGVVVVAVVLMAVMFLVRSRTAAVEDLWRRKAQLTFDDPQTGKTSLEALGNLANEASDQQFILASLIDQGQTALQLSEKSPLPPDPELNQVARQAFQELLRRFPTHPLAIGVAESGLATVEENAFVLDADLNHREQAKKHLEAMVGDSRLAGLPVQQLARDRMDRLDDVFRRVQFVYEPPPPPELEGPPEPADTESTLPVAKPVEREEVDAEPESDDAGHAPAEPGTTKEPG